MRITSSLVSFALYLGFAIALVIPDVRVVSRSADDISRDLAGGKRQAGGPLGPEGGGDGNGLGGTLGGGDLPGGGLPGGGLPGGGLPGGNLPGSGIH